MAEMKILTQAGLEYLVQKIDTQLEGKVNIETGKGLSTNDYTTAEKQALAKVVQDVEGIVAVGGQANVIETVKVDGVALTPDASKAVNIDLSAYALKSELVAALHWRGTVATVDALPTGAAQGDVYHVEADSGEYAWDGSNWESLGSIVDLSDYYKKSEADAAIQTAIAGKAEKTYVDEQLALKAVAANTYTKGEVDSAISGAVAPLATSQALTDGLALKADKSTTYTKGEVDALVSPKADKTYVDTELGKKANADVTYTKTEVDGFLAGKTDNGHKHEIADVNGLQDALNLKANAADFTAISNAEIDALFA